jgi:hypothetical protein
MGGVPAGRSLRSVFAALVTLCLASPAASFDFFDGRVSVHGFYEQQIRSIWEDFNARNDWDLTQWYHVLNLEIEADIAEDWGPFDLLSAYIRAEVRYDCVWRRACGLFRSADVYGDRSGRLPQRLSDGRRPGFAGTQFTIEDSRIGDADTRGFNRLDDDLSRLGFENRKVPGASRKAADFPFIYGFSEFFTQRGPDDVLGTLANPGDDPTPFVFERLLGRRCVYGHQQRRGQNVRVLPHDPGCRIPGSGFLRDRPNPFNPQDINRVVLARSEDVPDGPLGGSAALPFRPAPRYRFDGPRAPRGEAQGIFVPSQAHAERLRRRAYDNPDQNFRQRQLEWNRGASQQDEKEFKEGFLDMEFFDSRLWVRLGKQNIVWGKTELFRTTDTFNPQDFGLASLPSLEESRIALWAIRAVWSFYDVGPLEDVRLEVGMNYDQFEPHDIGRCGEPYAPRPGCDKTFGLQGHGLVGAGLAGEIRPPNPWNSGRGIEVGARLEFRYNRFSVAVSDFWGFNHFPHAERLFNYTRNVDPVSGRPRKAESQGRCRTGREAACLTPGTALREHHANQQIFAMICAGSVGVVDIDRAACGQSLFNSQVIADPDMLFSPRLMMTMTNILSGQLTAAIGGAGIYEGLADFNAQTLAQLGKFPHINRFTSGLFGANTPTPLVPLSRDAGDGAAATLTAEQAGDSSFFLWHNFGVQRFLTPEQQALLGCGPFYQTQCDIDGIDLLNAEASAMFQSFPLFEGTGGIFWDTTNRSLAQPGTVGFRGGPVCTRFEGGRLRILPGCRGPGDPGYDPSVDGTTTGPRATAGVAFGAAFQRVQPFTGQAFHSEMAVLSWNFLMLLVGFSRPPEGQRPSEIHFDRNRPFRTGGCSYREPQWCEAVAGLIRLTALGRPDIRAGGSGEFGRRDFLWSSGAEVVLRYDKRNVLGLAMDFAEDVTKTNWSLEFTWAKDLTFQNVDRIRGSSKVDAYNLTVSIDRPTFMNFLNANRTFFFNTQVFFQYLDGYERGITFNGPWNILGTFTVQTGYFQDRLLPSATAVFDMRSNSGAFLPQVGYRFTENFSATVGVAVFWGREQLRPLDLHPPGPDALRGGRHADKQPIENILTAIRERDEIFLRIRYTF